MDTVLSLPLPLLLLFSYALGCFTTGYYLVRIATGADIRTLASGTAGSRNVGRLLGRKGFAATFAGDAGKGLLTVWLAQRVGAGGWVPAAALLAAVAGHVWPAQLRFRGGKGLATYAGGMLLLQPLVLALSLAVCACLAPLLGGVTRGALLALASSPLVMIGVAAAGGGEVVRPQLGLYCALVGLILYAHRANIGRELRAKASEEE